MSIRNQFDKEADVERLGPSDGDTEEFLPHLSGIPCHLQPLEDAFSQDLQGSFGKDFLMFCQVNDIKEGDRIIQGSDRYRVVGLETFHFLGEPRHMELRIRRFHD